MNFRKIKKHSRFFECSYVVFYPLISVHWRDHAFVLMFHRNPTNSKRDNVCTCTYAVELLHFLEF